MLHTQRLALPDQFDLPRRFDLACCSDCGMVYSDVGYSEEQIQAYYSADTYQFGGGDDPTFDSEPPSSRAERDRLATLARYVAGAFEDRSIRILDAGCASGLLLSLLRDEGFTRAEGIDPSESAVRTAERCGLAARVGSLERPPDGMGRYDLVILSHVLEHVLDPAGTLSRARDLLRPGGHLYIEVPDAARYDSFLIEPFNEINLEHINHFSLAHLDMLLARHGYRCVAGGSRDFLLHEEWPYPAVYGLWTQGPSRPATNADLGALERSVRRYVARSDDLLHRIDYFLSSQLRPDQPVAVRCLGYRAWILLGSSALRDFEITRFVDTHPLKQLWSVDGVPVVGPGDDAGSDLPVVVLAYHAERAIRREYHESSPGRRVLCLGRSQLLPAGDLGTGARGAIGPARVR